MALRLQHCVAALGLASLSLHHTSQAQAAAATGTSIFNARILDERTERPIANASILLPGLERTARSDPSGNLKLARLPAGKHIALVRAIGYDSLLFALDIAQGDSAEADLMLTPIAQHLEKVKVEATGGLAAARMAEFEDRKKLGFGKFLDSTVFQQDRRRPFADVLASRIAGIGFGKDSKFLVARRGALPGRPVGACYANIVVDGISLGRFDLSLIDPDEVLAVEYHTVATVPLKYRNTSIGADGSATCGTLIVWRK